MPTARRISGHIRWYLYCKSFSGDYQGYFSGAFYGAAAPVIALSFVLPGIHHSANISKSFLDRMQEICYTGNQIFRKGGEPVANKSKYQFDSKIHIYRATKRMTQQELADLVGVSRQTIMQLERNRYNPFSCCWHIVSQKCSMCREDLFDFKEEQ